MSEKNKTDINDIASTEYQHGFTSDFESEFIPKGLSEDIVRLISKKKEEPEWLLDFRLNAFRKWQKMTMPTWAHLNIPKIDFQDIIYYSAPKNKFDPKITEMADKLGISQSEVNKLLGLDVVVDSSSVITTQQKELAKIGIIFSSFSDAVKEHPDLVRKYLASVVPYSDNY